MDSSHCNLCSQSKPPMPMPLLQCPSSYQYSDLRSKQYHHQALFAQFQDSCFKIFQTLLQTSPKGFYATNQVQSQQWPHFLVNLCLGGDIYSDSQCQSLHGQLTPSLAENSCSANGNLEQKEGKSMHSLQPLPNFQ